MSVTGFFSDVESAAGKVGTFIIKEMTAAETLLGAKTGNAKLNLVVTATETALGVLGIDTTKVQSELQAVVTALVNLFNKAGIFTTSTTPPAA
jgi:hypothetical protein